MKQVKRIIQNQWADLEDDKMILVQGNHDPADTTGLAQTGPLEYKDFIIYVINEDDYPSKQGESSVRAIVEKTTEELKVWLDEKISEKETRPIFIATHTGLHYDIDRADGNNQYAYILFDAVNEAAGKLDITFFFGHNHTNGDELVGGSITGYTKGDKLDVCTETSIADRKGKATVLNFNYLNYGYVGYVGDIYNNPAPVAPTNELAVSELLVYEDRIDVVRYGTGGILDKYLLNLRRDYRDKSEFGTEYKLTYESDGGTVIDAYETTQAWSTVSRVTPVKDGAKFKYWSTEENGKGVRYNPGDSIYIEADTVLYAQYEILAEQEVQSYRLVDTLTPGKQYVLVWNSEFYKNEGTKYALTDASSNAAAIDESMISENGSVIKLPATAEFASSIWDCTYNTGSNPGIGYMLQNIRTKNFLKWQNNTVAAAADPTTEWKAYFWQYKTGVSGENGNVVNQLVPNSDSTRFIRYSVGSKVLKAGKTSTVTDPRNSNVYIYEKEDTAEQIWKKADALESNGEYLIVAEEAAKALTVNKRTIGEKDIEIRQGEDGAVCIEYAAEYNDPAVLHSYQVRPDEFWMSTWNYNYTDTSGGEVLYVYAGSSSKELRITGNHFDDRYYTRFYYGDGELTAYKGSNGTESEKIFYNNGFVVTSGDNVALFKRVTKEMGVSEEEHEHVFDNYISDQNATCYADGTQSAVCACGVKDVQPLKNSKLEHEFEYGSPIKADEACHYAICKNCGAERAQKHYGGVTGADGKAICEVCAREYEVVQIVVDKTALENAINGALTDGDRYTKDSWDAYQAELNAAKDVFENAQATQDDVNSAVRALAAARRALKKVIPEILADFTFDTAEEDGSINGGYAKATGTYALEDNDEGKALKLDGSGQHLVVTDVDGESLLTDVEEMTVSYQIRPSTSATNWGFFAAPNANRQEWLQEHYLGIVDISGTTSAERYNNSGARPEVANYVTGYNGWYYVTAVYSKDSTTLYIDGVKAAEEASSYTLTDILGDNSILYIGKSTWVNGEYATALIDNYKIVSKALTAEEVKAEADKYAEKEPEPIEADKAVLKRAIDTKIDAEDTYTAESWKAYADALAAANTVYGNKDASQAEVDEAAKALTDAVKALTKKPEPPRRPFVDVNRETGDWYYDAVYYNYDKGIMKGVDETHFEPLSNLARAQFAIILHNIEGNPSVAYEPKFKDVADEQWYTNAIMWASSKEIVTGYTDGSEIFGWGDKILREQMAVMMYRYAKNFKGYGVSDSADFDRFEDAASVSEYAKEAMKWAVGAGIITGKDNGTRLDPQGVASRAECAIIIQRFLERYK